MDRGRADALAVFPGWTWDPIEDFWETGFRELVAYATREGNVRVPAEHRTASGFPLGSWVRSHRRPGGGRRTITAEQRRRLEALPGWSYEPANDVFWERAFAAFEKFVRREQRCYASRGHVEDGVNLDAWSKQQRARYHRGELADDRRARLEELPGWSWSPQRDAWEAGFAILVAHVAATGSAVARSDEIRDDYPLGAWAAEQRVRYNRGDMPDARRDRLSALPGWSWAPHEDSWERHFAALLTFVDREGHARVPTDHVEAGLPLAAWVIRHRQDHKAGRVPARRVARLEALPGWTWDVLAARWLANYEAVARYAQRAGHARVPASHVEDGRKLGTWVIAQRHAARKGTLSPERRARLEVLPGWQWNVRGAGETTP